MNSLKESVYEKLAELKINYEIIEHPAVYTIEEMESLDIECKEEIPKNLFLRDDKKKCFLLLVLSKDRKVDLKALSKKMNCRPLGFASEDLLKECLGLTKGSVTPFGILNDEERKVDVLIDRTLLSLKRIGIHPNDNTTTVFLTLKDLETVVTDHGNTLKYIDI